MVSSCINHFAGEILTGISILHEWPLLNLEHITLSLERSRVKSLILTDICKTAERISVTVLNGLARNFVHFNLNVFIITLPHLALYTTKTVSMALQ